MPTGYILIDFENVQPDTLGAFVDGAFKIKVFVGAKQARVSFGLANALQALGTAAEYVQIAGSGRNALDLHIAYTIGGLAAQEPDAHFHIISKDTDFDPLIAHLKSQKIICHRWAAVTDIPHPRAAKRPASKPAAKPAPKNDRASEIGDNLKKRERGRPSTLRALTSMIKSHYRGTGIADAEVGDIMGELERRGLLAVKDGKVTYR